MASLIQVFSYECCDFLRTAFSIEQLRWLLSYLLEKEEEESVEQRSVGKFFKWKKKMKTFHLTSTSKFWCQLKQKYICKSYRTVCSLFLSFSSNFLSCDSCLFIFCVFIPDKLKNISCCIFVSIFSSRNWELLRKTAVRQNITKTVIFLTKLELVFYIVYYIRKSLNIFEVKSCAGILLGLWWKSPFGSFTEQLLWIFLHCCE